MAKAGSSPYKSVRTTVTLPANLLEWSQKFVDKGSAPNVNALIVRVLERFLIELERQEVDQQLVAMADDFRFQELGVAIAEEFADSDWEALNSSTLLDP